MARTRSGKVELPVDLFPLPCGSLNLGFQRANANLRMDRLSQMIINLLTNAIKFTKMQTQRRIEVTIGVSKIQQPLDSCEY